MCQDVLCDDLAMSLLSNWYLKQTRDMLLHSGELPFVASFTHMLISWFLFLSGE